ncbi:MAG: hypothetical protein HQL56_06860 [Magnetococcales bacterium]|nr:hypothetical protein [Magnetococcales bacterium]
MTLLTSDSIRPPLPVLLSELRRRQARRRLWTYYPDTGPLRRELYPKHIEFFRLGATNRQRCFLAANRIGKTEGTGGYEMTLHLTGEYPEWWQGRRFDRPVVAWAVGKTRETTKTILQTKMLGGEGKRGQGLIPGDWILDTTPMPGVPGAVKEVMVRHKSGGVSVLTFKSYDQGRESFEGSELDVIWCDEEVPEDIYGECTIRIMETPRRPGGGILMLTFTPLKGLTRVVLGFFRNDGARQVGNGKDWAWEDAKAGKATVTATWEDVPHLTETEKAMIREATPPHLRDARSKGVPQVGAGAIYPVNEADVVCDSFPIPAHWPRICGLDPGWNKTAAVWVAWDRDCDTAYVYAEYTSSQQEYVLHATAIKTRGEWIPVAIDPASMGSQQSDGKQLFEMYRQLGLRVIKADNAVEAGIAAVLTRLNTGKLKIMANCTGLLREMRIYSRDEKGRVVKKDDHEMDAWRYAIMCLLMAVTKPVDRPMIAPRNWGRAGI